MARLKLPGIRRRRSRGGPVEMSTQFLPAVLGHGLFLYEILLSFGYRLELPERFERPVESTDAQFVHEAH
jgi:hypothetical protein